MSRQTAVALRPLQSSASGANLVGGVDGRKAQLPATGRNKLKSMFGRGSKARDENGAPAKTLDVATAMATQAVDAAANTDVSLPSAAPTADSALAVRDMLLSAEPNERYFELLAEQRRAALAEALHENMQLCAELARLREANRELQVQAEEGQYFARLLREAMDDEEAADGDDNTAAAKPDDSGVICG